jgi:hypothetical protein
MLLSQWVGTCACCCCCCWVLQSPEEQVLKNLGMEGMMSVKLKEEDVRRANLEVTAWSLQQVQQTAVLCL